MKYKQICILGNHKELKDESRDLVAYGFKLPAEWNGEDVEKAAKSVIAHCFEIAPLYSRCKEQHTNILDADVVFSDEVFENASDIISRCETIAPDARIFIAKGYSDLRNDRELYWIVRLIINKEEWHCINICDFFQFAFIERKFLKGEDF